MQVPAPPDQIADAVDLVRQRAIKRYAIQLGAVIPALGIVAGILVSTQDGNNSTNGSAQHHPSVIALVIVALVTIAAIAVYYVATQWVLKHRIRSRVPLIWGFSGRDRRSIIRTVRAGKPSDDPLTRYIGADLAGRIVRQRTQTVVVFGLICTGLIIWTIVGWRESYSQAERPLFLLVLMVVAFLRNRQTLNGAVKYLNRRDTPVGQHQPGR